MNVRVLTTAVLPLCVWACSGDGETGADSSASSELALAEMFVDAFYSFDQNLLAPLLLAADGSRLRILEYQAWAEGGHYGIIERMPCEATAAGVVGCSITVRDDLIAALGLSWWVTDHFDLSFENGNIVSVEASSNDPQVYLDAEAWVRENRASLIEQPCAESPETGFGLTPDLCAAAMAQGYLDFAESDDFPEELPAAPGS